MRGTILKAIAGFYYVKAEGNIYPCKARGIFKKNGMKPAVGDKVEMEPLEEGEGIIDAILPRKNQFIRPFVANVDLFLVVVAVTNPAPTPATIDRFLVMAEKHRTDVILCLNKVDLEEGLDHLRDIYQNIYPMMEVSAKTGSGMEALQAAISGKQAALAGPSGVGKSAILNYLLPTAAAETGGISQKTKRGKHTTRHTELFDLGNDTAIFDTPGFTAFHVTETGETELHFLFPEFQPFLGQCKYDDCRHTKEPGCAICAALEADQIHPSRYQSYCTLLEEIQQMPMKHFGRQGAAKGRHI